MLSIVDTHAHLEELENLATSIENARNHGIISIIAVGSDHVSNNKIMDICKIYSSFVYPALGMHPMGLDKTDASLLDITIRFIEENMNSIVAIGEIGLDYDKRVLKKTTKEHQTEVFSQLLKLARKYDKPVSIHSRYAWHDCFELVLNSGIKKAVFHWFTGFSSVLREIIDAGYYISCTPAAEYHEEHRRAIIETPLDKLLLETDSPVYYGRENRYSAQPSDTVKSLKAVSTLKEVAEEVVARQTTENAVQLFNLHLKS